jgi:hypothetical protein
MENSVHTYRFNSNNPLILGEHPKLGVKSLFMWNTIPNISAKFKNNTIKITKPSGVSEVITFDTGMYDVHALSDYVHSRTDGISFDINYSTFKCQVSVESGYKLDLTNGQFHKILGLESKVYDRDTTGPDIINITRGIDHVYLRCSAIDRQFGADHDILYDLLPFTTPGAAIIEKIDQPEFYNCHDHKIFSFTLRLTDANNELIQLQEPIQLKLVFRSL